jgi:glycerol-3-phosphate dehydrogenase
MPHALTRGLRTVLVERDDFGSGTSSKSTKLVHGGVRYLEKAFWSLDLGQLKLVTEALQERRVLLDNAPHLTSALPILMVSAPPSSRCPPSAQSTHAARQQSMARPPHAPHHRLHTTSTSAQNRHVVQLPAHSE